jgi:ribonuclease-3
MEAVLGAVYLDAGIDACSALLRRLIETQLVDIDAGGVAKDAKTRLQELLQGQGLALPIYETLRMEGEPHAQAFTVRCRVEDRGGAGTEATGTGPSRRRAEQEAAKAVLAWLEHDAN